MNESTVIARLRVRVGQEDVHYGQGIVAGAFVMKLMGDLATEITIQTDQSEGLLRAYELVEFLRPVHAGDYLEAEAKLVARGRTSRTIDFTVHKAAQVSEGGKVAHTVPERPLVAKARGTSVVGSTKQSSGVKSGITRNM